METTGLIVEYNPFHNGHMHHLLKSKAITNNDSVVAVMSGNFVQRGIPAFIDKWNRTKIALLNGVDLVIELPVIYSASSAEFFSFGAISLLNSLGIIKNLCFGSESGDIKIIKEVAELLHYEPIEYKKLLKQYLEDGNAFPVARSKATAQYFSEKNYLDTFLKMSNNILAVEYCKSLIKLNSNIEPFTIKREGSSYNSESLESSFSSATAIRKHLKNSGNELKMLKSFLPDSVIQYLQELTNENYHFVREDSFFQFIKYKCLTNKQSLLSIPDINEGLQNKIYDNIINSHNYEQLIENIKSKRYAKTRINRILCQLFIGFDSWNTENLRNNPCPYARILGFNNKGRELLKIMKKTSTIPLITKVSKCQNTVMDIEIQSTKAYSLINTSVSPMADYITSPIYMNL